MHVSDLLSLEQTKTGSTCAPQLPGALAAYLSLQQYCTAENIHDYLKRSCTLTCLFIYINIFSDYQPDKTVITEFSILKRPQWCQGSAGELNILSSIIPTSFFYYIPVFRLVKVAGAAFFGWENQNILSLDAFPSSSGRPARCSLHGDVIPLSWPGSSTDRTDPGRIPKPDASTFLAAS